MSNTSPSTPDDAVRGLSLPRRVGQAAVGLGGLLGAGLIGLLWATEPTTLPARTQAAFAAMIAIGLTWAGVAGWALARRPIFAIDRILATSLALGCSTVWTVWGAVLAWTRGSVAGLLTVAGLGLVLVVVSGALLRRALAYRATLMERKRHIEQRSASDTPVRDTRRAPLPIGPLALALHLGGRAPSGRVVAILSLVLVTALVAGLVLALA
jgi:hypothetical protein